LVPWSGEVLKFTKPKNDRYSDGDVKCLIDTGAEVCKAIKRCFPQLTWMQVADKFTKLKNVCRVYHPGLQDIPLIRELLNYTDQDIKDALNIERMA
jgi:hypothetical protein